MDLGTRRVDRLDLGRMDVGGQRVGRLDLGRVDVGRMDVGSGRLGNPELRQAAHGRPLTFPLDVPTGDLRHFAPLLTAT